MPDSSRQTPGSRFPQWLFRKPNGTISQALDGGGNPKYLNVASIQGLQLALDGKEPAITAGTTAQYWRGDKTWQTLPAVVTWSTLTGKPTTLSGYGITDAYPLTGNPSAFLTTITSGQVTSALGFTPYNAINPSNYITTAVLSGYLTSAIAASTYQPVNSNLTAIAALTTTTFGRGFLVLADAQAARTAIAISLTTNGSGSASYSLTTGVLNVPTNLSGTLIGTTTVGETGLTLLALSVRRVSISVAGVVTTGRYAVIPTAAPPAGFSIQDAYCAVNGTLVVGVLVPIITGSYSISVAVIQVNAT